MVDAQGPGAKSGPNSKADGAPALAPEPGSDGLPMPRRIWAICAISFGTALFPVFACELPAGASANSDDCDDLSAVVVTRPAYLVVYVRYCGSERCPQIETC